MDALFHKRDARLTCLVRASPTAEESILGRCISAPATAPRIVEPMAIAHCTAWLSAVGEGLVGDIGSFATAFTSCLYVFALVSRPHSVIVVVAFRDLYLLRAHVGGMGL